MNLRALSPLSTRSLRSSAVVTLCTLVMMSGRELQAAAPVVPQQQAAPVRVSSSPNGVPFPPAAIATLLPGTVYFQGKSAPIQLRNAGAVSFGPGAIVWIALVDTSGYATDVQERYQFYLVTEAPILLGASKIAAGAYGGGFVGERFLLMDLGGHSLAEGPVQSDPALKRPRPLQLLPDTPGAVKLYLGRHWVEIKTSR